MIYHVSIGERVWTVEIEGDAVSVDGVSFDVDLARVEGGPVRSLVVNRESHRLVARRSGDARWDLHVRGRRVTADVVDERTRVIRSMTKAVSGPAGPRPIRAPMPGMVVRIEVAEGDHVRAGQGVVIVEAMKMENELAAPAEAIVGRIHVTEGQAVEKDEVLVDLVAVGQESAS